MSTAMVLLASMVAFAALDWFFFATRRARSAALSGVMQRVEVTVEGAVTAQI
jgi:Cu+-exporting ATPase